QPRMKKSLRDWRGLRPYSLRKYGHVMAAAHEKIASRLARPSSILVARERTYIKKARFFLL
ncbi:MAG: hypothetical protein LUG93_03215, partial [Lachnospiraceae bacterium]|nr:hypothetical protein [Lachnospiraceae bacterium]